MIESEDYRYDTGTDAVRVTLTTASENETGLELLVPVLIAKNHYLDRLAETRKKFKEFPALFSCIHHGETYEHGGELIPLGNDTERIPYISMIKLFNDTDTLVTPRGEIALKGLTNYGHVAFPQFLKDYSDLKLMYLMMKVLAPSHELLQLRNLERRLGQEMPDYRRAGVVSQQK